MAVEFQPDQKKRMFEAIQGFYNQGIADAQAYLQSKLIDMRIDLHEEVVREPGTDT